MSSSPDRDLDRRRRDLYAISLGLLLFNLAGGTLSSSASTLFGTIAITRPLVLGFGAWVVWVYFVWRFWLASKPAWASYLDDVDAEIESSTAYGAYMRRVCSAVIELANKVEIGEISPEEIGNNLGDKAQLRQSMKSVIDEGMRYKVVPRSYASDFQNRRGVNDRGSSLGSIPGIPEAALTYVVDRHALRGIERGKLVAAAMLKAALRRDAFTDKVLPTIIAWLSLLAAIARLIWNAM